MHKPSQEKCTVLSNSRWYGLPLPVPVVQPKLVVGAIIIFSEADGQASTEDFRVGLGGLGFIIV